MNNKVKLVFFGGSEFSVYVLDELKLHNILPELIITTPDKPKGRKLVLTPTPVKIWAQKNNIPVIDPISLKKNNEELVAKLKSENFDLFLVASYGKIIPRDIFDIPIKKTLNIHPSLLPKYRGASPIQSQILNGEKEIGVTIMQIDEGMDTGPVVIQREFSIFNFQFSIPSRKELEKILAIEGARLFAHILPEWLIDVIDPIMQDESKATLCQKIEKEDGEIQIDLDNLPIGEEASKILCKIKAFEEWPTAYFFLDTSKRSEGDTGRKRIIITDATIEKDSLKILKVIPEGKKEMPFEDFLRGQRSL